MERDMKRNARILVTHDFSERSHLALDYGIELAVENNAELHFLHIETMNAKTKIESQEDKTKAEILREKLRSDILDSLKKQGMEYTDLRVLRYSVLRDVAPAPAILDYCADYNIDLVVMGTHGRRGLSRKMLGSVAEEVVRLAPCTVFTVREQASFKSLEENLKRVAVPVDFSDYSLAALRYAKELAASFDARLNLAHVIEDRLHPIFYNAGITSVYEMHPDIETRVMKAMKEHFVEAGGPDIDVEFAILKGHAIDQIADWAKNIKSDLIVLATHGLSGLNRAILGSVAEGVVRHAHCPVITVKTENQTEKAQNAASESSTVNAI